MGSIVEENSDHNSFGFRLRRDIGDVIQQLIIFLDKPYGATKILDADILKCFEKIDHNAILKDCIVFNKKPIAQWFCNYCTYWWEILELAKYRIETFLKTKGLELNKAKTSKVYIKDWFQIVGFWIQKQKYHVDVFISKIYQRYKHDTECRNPRWTRITDLYLIRVALYQLSYGILYTSTTNFHIIIRHEMSNFYVDMTTYIYRLQPCIHIKWTKVHYKEGPLLVNEEHLEEHKDKHQFKYYK